MKVLKTFSVEVAAVDEGFSARFQEAFDDFPGEFDTEESIGGGGLLDGQG